MAKISRSQVYCSYAALVCLLVLLVQATYEFDLALKDLTASKEMQPYMTRAEAQVQVPLLWGNSIVVGDWYNGGDGVDFIHLACPPGHACPHPAYRYSGLKRGRKTPSPGTVANTADSAAFDTSDTYKLAASAYANITISWEPPKLWDRIDTIAEGHPDASDTSIATSDFVFARMNPGMVRAEGITTGLPGERVYILDTPQDHWSCKIASVTHAENAPIGQTVRSITIVCGPDDSLPDSDEAYPLRTEDWLQK